MPCCNGRKAHSFAPPPIHAVVDATPFPCFHPPGCTSCSWCGWKKAPATDPRLLLLDAYQRAALRTQNTDLSVRDAMAQGALGVAGEAGEVADLIKKHLFHDKRNVREQVKKELGDVLWYVATLAHTFGLTLSEVANANIDKLHERYPEGFKPGGGVR